MRSRSGQRCRPPLADVTSRLDERPAAIGVTNQRETVVRWSRERSEPLERAVAWQDRRTSDRCRELRDEGILPVIRCRTGLVLDPVLLRLQARVALRQQCGRIGTRSGGRHDRQLDHLESDRWRRPRNRRHQRLPDHAVRHRRARMERRTLRVVRGADGHPARGAPVERRLRPDGSPCGLWRRACRSAASPATSRRRCSGRRRFQPGDAKNTYGTGSFVLMNVGLDPAGAGGGPSHHGGVAAGGTRSGPEPHLRLGGRSLRHRSDGAMAARRGLASSTEAVGTGGTGRPSAPPPAACTWSRRSPASAARTGIPVPAARSSD